MAKIIVVDDDPSNITLLKMLLELEGFVVMTSPDIDKAKAAMDASTDAFLIDCYLARGASGLDLCREIRQGKTSAPSQSAIIMASGDYRRENDAMEAGADHFLLKPYSPDVLINKLRELMHANAKEKDGE